VSGDGETPSWAPAGSRRRLVDAATVSGYRLGSLAARAVPGFATELFTTPIGFGASASNPQRRALVERHLQRADPTLRGAALRIAVQEAFEAYTRYWIESFRLPSLSKRTVAMGMTTDGYTANVVGGLARGNGVILALPHLGGWEWAGRWIADLGHPITVVVEQLEPPELFEWFVELRRDLGMNVVPLGNGAAREVLAALGRNEIVCLLCDRDLQRTGVPVTFFGERTTLPAGPAMLGLRTGAWVLPTAVYFTGRRRIGHFGLVRPPLDTERRAASLRDDVARVTQAIAHELEQLIRRAPSQWHMFQPNWPSDPGYDERAV
jgi:phosphatidylinositol dimannoside acyltransferase